MLFRRYLRWIIRYMLLESGQILTILIIEPLHLEVQVHVVCTFTQAVLLVLCIKEKVCSVYTLKKHNTN